MVLFLFLLNWAIFDKVHAEDYFFPAPRCPTGTIAQVENIWEVPKEYLSSTVSDQGESQTCGFHVGTLLLNSLRKYLHQNETCTDLSVLDGIFEHGTAQEKLSSSSNIGPFLIMASRKGKLSPELDATVRSAYELDQVLKSRLERCNRGKCSQTQGSSHAQCLVDCCQEQPDFKKFYGSNEDLLPVIERILQDPKNPIRAASLKVREVKEDVPPFRFLPTDIFDSNEKKAIEEVQKIILDYKNSEPLLPLGLGTCISSSEGACEKAHAVAVRGVDQVKCLSVDGKVQKEFNQVRIINSWGDHHEESLNLLSLAKSVAKFGSILQIYPCKKGDEKNCRESPLEEGPKSLPLLHYIWAGDVAHVKQELKKTKRDLNQIDGLGNLPLNIATSAGYAEVVRELLADSRIKPNTEDQRGYTAFQIAIEKGYDEVVSLLLTHPDVKANRRFRDGDLPLQAAMRLGNDKIILQLIARPEVKLDELNENGQTYLWRAAEKGKTEVVRQLLARPHPEADRADRDGYTPLWIAASKGNVEVCRLLLERTDVDPNLPSSNGMTPLEVAVAKKRTEVVQLFSEKANHRDGPRTTKPSKQ